MSRRRAVTTEGNGDRWRSERYRRRRKVGMVHVKGVITNHTEISERFYYYELSYSEKKIKRKKKKIMLRCAKLYRNFTCNCNFIYMYGPDLSMSSIHLHPDKQPPGFQRRTLRLLAPDYNISVVNCKLNLSPR